MAKLQELTRQHDTLDLARAILVTSKDGMSWIHKMSMFAKSMGVLSAVSYVFGEMDTSPSGILIDKVSGATTYTECVATGERKFRCVQGTVRAENDTERVRAIWIV